MHHRYSVNKYPFLRQYEIVVPIRSIHTKETTVFQLEFLLVDPKQEEFAKNFTLGDVEVQLEQFTLI